MYYNGTDDLHNKTGFVLPLLPDQNTFIQTFLFGLYDQNGSVPPLILDPSTIECYLKPPEPKVALILSVVLLVNFILALLGNVLVGWVIASSRQVLNSSEVYLFHLTVADGLMALTVPFFAVDLTHGWLFGDFMCKCLHLVKNANFYTSILFLACISIDRYEVIVHANEARGNKRCSKLLCALVWAVGSAFALPALFYDVKHLPGENRRLICNENFDVGSASSWRLATRMMEHIFGFLIPLLVMVVCYSVTVMRLLQSRGFRKHRAMRVIIAVMIAFLLCWTPYHATTLTDTLMRTDLVRFDCTRRRQVTLALTSTHTLALLHSSVNPFLYAFVGERFRKKMMLLLQNKVKQERRPGSTVSRSTSQTSEGKGTFL